MNGQNGISEMRNTYIKVMTHYLRSLTSILFLVLFSLAIAVADTCAQDDPNETAPPPLKLVSKDEKTRLDSEGNVKVRTKLALDMMTARLASAEKLVSISDFSGMFRELGGFEGVLDNQLAFLIKNDNDSGRVLDNFKRLEIGLRGYIPRIETIRRDLPLRYEPFVRSVGRYIRDARTRALDPLFSDTVVHEPKKPE